MKKTGLNGWYTIFLLFMRPLISVINKYSQMFDEEPQYSIKT